MTRHTPSFRDENDEAKFWDTHDSTEFLTELVEDWETVFVRPEIGVIEIRPSTWKRLLDLARRRRTTPQRLEQRWLDEKLAKS